MTKTKARRLEKINVRYDAFVEASVLWLKRQREAVRFGTGGGTADDRKHADELLKKASDNLSFWLKRTARILHVKKADMCDVRESSRGGWDQFVSAAGRLLQLYQAAVRRVEITKPRKRKCRCGHVENLIAADACRKEPFAHD